MPLLGIDPYLLLVEGEADVIELRQDVRQFSRKLGLGLIQQARVASAMATIARGFLSLEFQAEFYMRVANDAALNALEIVCVPRTAAAPPDQAVIERALALTNTRMLVDETHLQVNGMHISLRLRIWLVSTPCRGFEVLP